MNLIAPLVAIASLVLLAQALFTLYLMLYAWEYPERLEVNRGPRTFSTPKLSFTILLPARHEESVIYQTIRSIAAARYPKHLLEIVVITSVDDVGTAAEVQRAIAALPHANIRLETYAGEPVSKPRALNVGFARSVNEVVTIFDAEDDIDASIFHVVNTVMLREKVGIVQSGVQLMNFRDHWFGIHNCLEYFFWFKSRLHFHAQIGMIPLGGNTVFLRRPLVERVGGWDEDCLTEDADIGLRLSTLAEPIRVVYDAAHVTREETPDSLASLIRQRTRWSQGFIQVLRKGDWTRLPRFRQRLLAVYTLGYPILHVMLMLLWPFAIFGGLFLKMPVIVTMIAFLPLYAVVFQFLVSTLGAFMFAREYGQRLPIRTPFLMAVTFLPYQWVVGFSALRAAYRELEERTNWEKTLHLGAHRNDPGRAAAPSAATASRKAEHPTTRLVPLRMSEESGAASDVRPLPSGVPANLWAIAFVVAGLSLAFAIVATPATRPVAAIAVLVIAAVWIVRALGRRLALAVAMTPTGSRPAWEPSQEPLSYSDGQPSEDRDASARMAWVRESIGTPKPEFMLDTSSYAPRVRTLFRASTLACAGCGALVPAQSTRCARCGLDPHGGPARRAGSGLAGRRR